MVEPGGQAYAGDPSGGSVKQYASYYPYGLRISTGGIELSGGSSTNEDLLGGKTLTEAFGLGWYHYGARFYDVATARWTTMDPADEFHSPYVYVGGDPVNLVDPDGRQSAAAGCESNGPTTCNAQGGPSPMTTELNALPAFDASNLEDFGLANVLLGVGMSLDAVAGLGKASEAWRTYPVPNTTPRYSFTRARVFAERLAGRDMGTVSRYATHASRLGKASTVAGLIGTGYQAYEDPELLQTPGFAISTGLGITALAVSAPITGMAIAVGGAIYVGTDYLCDGATSGFCGGFNYVTESTYGELYDDAVRSINGDE